VCTHSLVAHFARPFLATLFSVFAALSCSCKRGDLFLTALCSNSNSSATWRHNAHKSHQYCLYATVLFAVLSYPVSHSLSPVSHSLSPLSASFASSIACCLAVIVTALLLCCSSSLSLSLSSSFTLYTNCVLFCR